MMKISLGGKEIVVKPKRLLDYVEKVDFIKMRRGTAFDLLKGFPPNMTEENYKIAVSLAMKTVYTNASAVSPEEELAFDKSEEGFYYDLWRCLPKIEKKKGVKPSEESYVDGINRARRVWDDATDAEKIALRLAMNALDENHLSKNSSGPNPNQETTDPGEPQS